MASVSTGKPVPISGRKRLREAMPDSKPTKSRSKLPRRGRVPALPIVHLRSNHTSSYHAENAHDEEEADSSSICLQSNHSNESSEYRRITRSYSRMIRNGGMGGDPKRSMTDVSVSRSAIGAEASEVVEGFRGGDSKKSAAASNAVRKETEISNSCLDSAIDANGGGKSMTEEAAKSQISQNSVAPINAPPCDRDLESDLACSERLSRDDDDEESSEYSTCEMTLSEIEDELFGRSNTEWGSSDHNYSSSGLAASSSSSDFSKASHGNTTPSATFSLFLQLAQQFSSSSFLPDPGSRRESFEFMLMRFEDEDDEDSYRRLRDREREEAVLHDYTEEYSDTTDCGRLIVEQRLIMVNWMVEHSSAMELQSETLFLGVCLMDRCLSRGFFKSERNLQLLGIASITLATRIEENQPYNRIRHISFKVGTTYYSRSEVVAMEWLVQKVLRFKCFLPTIYHFLWYYLKAAKADADVQNLSRYLAVLSLLDHERLSFWPSSVAAGLVILACLATNHDDSCQMVMETHVRTKSDDLPECMQSLQWLVKYAC